MRFSKLQGLGNDFVLLDAFRETIDFSQGSFLARSLCDRRRGIGADGLLILEPISGADCAMRVFNADGSEAEMCGNGIRCLALYYQIYHAPQRNSITILTRAGIKTAYFVDPPIGATNQIAVDMGSPNWKQGRIPMITDHPEQPALAVPLEAEGTVYEATCVNVGNPHAVLFVDSVDLFPIERIGPIIEHSPLFPERINMQIVEVLSVGAIRLRTWERGAGLTPGCGTGACASVAAGVLRGLLGRQACVHLPGGDLFIEWLPNESLRMTGPAAEVFKGELISL